MFIIRLCLIGSMLLGSVGIYANGWTFSRNGNALSFNNSSDVVVYAGYRSDEFIANLRGKYNGLEDEKKVSRLLKQQNYIEVLNHLWSDPNAQRKIKWLKAKRHESHPILFFELAREYCLADPSLETYILRALPLIYAGMARAGIDCFCTADESVAAAPGALQLVYIQSILETVHKHHSPEDIARYMKKHFLKYWEKKKKYTKRALAPFIGKKIDQSLPSPEWVFPHGLSAFRGNMHASAHPRKEWGFIRREKALELSKEIDLLDKEIMWDPAGYIEELFADYEDE